MTTDYLSDAFTPVHDELDQADLRVTGELPARLVGRYVRNGPNPQFAPVGRYHLFDGDGMLHGVELEGGRARYRNRWIESRALLAERAAGHALYGGLSEFVMPPPEVAAASGFMKNTANTHIVRHAGRYLALMEASPPTEVTAALETVGEYDFGGALAGGMTAHPKYDPVTGEMHFFGYSPFPPYVRYHVADASGALVHSTEIELPRAVMMHDFVLTESSVVFFDLPAVFDVNAMLAGGAGVRWEPEHGGRIGVLPRGGDGAAIRWTDVDPCYVFHFLNGWDDADGGIVIDGCRADALPISFGDQPAPDGDVSPRLHRWHITVDGSVRDEPLDDRPADFPRVNDDAVAGRRHRYGYLAAMDSDEGLMSTGVTAWDLDAGTSETYRFGPTTICGESSFAPDPEGSAENDGWLLNIVTDRAAGTSHLAVLDARDVMAGPVAEVELPHRVPFGFHGNWFAD
ncbi:MAG: carotenoid oxygenase family protein [Acidimicrobiales bacterium]